MGRGVGKIVQPKEIVQLAASDEAVDGAPAVGGITEIERRPTMTEVERAGDCEHGIAPFFDVQAAAIHAPEEAVVRIDGTMSDER
jgi:hypothetical protein